MAKKKEKSSVDTKWIIRVIVVITIISIGLFVYFRQKAKERYARTSARQAEWLAEEQSKVSLTCSGLLDIGTAKYTLYGHKEGTTTKVSDFDINLSGELITTGGSPLPAELNAGNADTFTIRTITPDGVETEILSGSSILSLSTKSAFLTSEGTFKISSGKITFPDLSLPEAPSGMRYSTWIVGEDDISLLSRFSSAKQLKPKEITADLSNAVVVVTVEPDWYKEELPFPFAILGAEIPNSIKEDQAYNLELGLDSLPYCVVD